MYVFQIRLFLAIFIKKIYFSRGHPRSKTNVFSRYQSVQYKEKNIFGHFLKKQRSFLFLLTGTVGRFIK